VTLYLLRHGIAEDRSASGTDSDRRLTARGRARMRRAAPGLRVLVGRVDSILTSPYPRAAETAAIAAAALPHAPKPRELDALTPDVPPMETLRALRSVAKAERVMLVGHEPLLSGLASLLLTGSPDGVRIDVRKGGCVALALRATAPRAATLLWVATPRTLRRLGRGAARRSS
jgi:phosphohistidine phosphatase